VAHPVEGRSGPVVSEVAVVAHPVLGVADSPVPAATEHYHHPDQGSEEVVVGSPEAAVLLEPGRMATAAEVPGVAVVADTGPVELSETEAQLSLRLTVGSREGSACPEVGLVGQSPAPPSYPQGYSRLVMVVPLSRPLMSRYLSAAPKLAWSSSQKSLSLPGSEAKTCLETVRRLEALVAESPARYR